MLVDSHCHLQDEQFDADRDTVIKRCDEAGMLCILAGDTLEHSQRAVQLAEQHPFLSCAVGLHPVEAVTQDWDEAGFTKLVTSPKVVAIGEIGLDYYRLDPNDSVSKKRQWMILQCQLRFAQEQHKPVVLHCRDAYDDLLDIIKDFPAVHVMLHTFVGNVAVMERFLDRGAYFSFSGIITFPKAEIVQQAAQAVPRERVLAETDAPYLAPVPYRGKRNEPIFVRAVLQKLSELRNDSYEEMERQTSDNALRFFGIAPSVKTR